MSKSSQTRFQISQQRSITKKKANLTVSKEHDQHEILASSQGMHSLPLRQTSLDSFNLFRPTQPSTTLKERTISTSTRTANRFQERTELSSKEKTSTLSKLPLSSEAQYSPSMIHKGPLKDSSPHLMKEYLPMPSFTKGPSGYPSANDFFLSPFRRIPLSYIDMPFADSRKLYRQKSSAHRSRSTSPHNYTELPDSPPHSSQHSIETVMESGGSPDVTEVPESPLISPDHDTSSLPDNEMIVRIKGSNFSVIPVPAESNLILTPDRCLLHETFYESVIAQLCRTTLISTLLTLHHNRPLFDTSQPLTQTVQLNCYLDMFRFPQEIIHTCPNDIDEKSSKTTCVCPVIRAERFYSSNPDSPTIDSLLNKMAEICSTLNLHHMARLLSKILSLERLLNLPFSELLTGSDDCHLKHRIFEGTLTQMDAMYLLSPKTIPRIILLGIQSLENLLPLFGSVFQIHVKDNLIDSSVLQLSPSSLPVPIPPRFFSIDSGPECFSTWPHLHEEECLPETFIYKWDEFQMLAASHVPSKGSVNLLTPSLKNLFFSFDCCCESFTSFNKSGGKYWNFLSQLFPSIRLLSSSKLSKDLSHISSPSIISTPSSITRPFISPCLTEEEEISHSISSHSRISFSSKTGIPKYDPFVKGLPKLPKFLSSTYVLRVTVLLYEHLKDLASILAKSALEKDIAQSLCVQISSIPAFCFPINDDIGNYKDFSCNFSHDVIRREILCAENYTTRCAPLERTKIGEL
jgi:hypothetical protein